jgi:hypothetical protein
MADSQNTRIASAIPQSPYMRLLELLSRLFAESTPDQLARAAGVFRAEAALALQLGQDDETLYFDAVAAAIAAQCVAKQRRGALS